MRNEAAETVVATGPSRAAEAGPATEELEQPEPTADELPPLEDLVKRIPAATRELADQLFRAKYIGARSVPRK